MFIFIGNQFIISKIKSAGILIYILREHNYSMALNFKVPVVLKKEKNIFIIILSDSTSRSFPDCAHGNYVMSLLSFGGAVLSWIIQHIGLCRELYICY